MGYKLEKPYTEEQRLDFIVTHNHNKGLRIEQTKEALYALEAWEKLVNGEVFDNTEEYEQDLTQKEQERINNLELSQEIFWNWMLPITKKDAIEQIQQIPVIKDRILNQLDNSYYIRESLLMDTLSGLYNISQEQLTELFEQNS